MAADPLARIEALMADRIGLRLDPDLRGRLSRAMQDEAAAAGLTDEGYAEVVAADEAVCQRLLDRITVQQTSFFRDPAVFEALATEVIPRLVEPVLVWSAGCSNGQEAYTLAMLLEESGAKAWRVLGTDVSRAALARAADGSYSEVESTGLTPRRRDTHMRPTSAGWRISDSLRSRVDFVHHNLTREEALLGKASCDLILCRNVMIYLSQPELLRLVDRFADAIRSDGYLILGVSESLWQLTDRFRLHRVGATFMYRPASVDPAPERRRSLQPALIDKRQSPTVVQLLAQGEAAAAAADFTAAANAFRQATNLDPDHPVPHFRLAICLEQSGRLGDARVALEAARAAFARCDKTSLQDDLDGFHVDELAMAIEHRLGSAS